MEEKWRREHALAMNKKAEKQLLVRQVSSSTQQEEDEDEKMSQASSQTRSKKNKKKLVRKTNTSSNPTFLKNSNQVAFLCKEVRITLTDPSKQPQAPFFEQQRGVVLFVDISGFSAMGKKFREDFTAVTATEMLANMIFGALERLTKICMCWGGDVAKFAGDALLCVWRVDKYLEGASASLEQALKQARRAAFEMLVAIEEPNFKGLKVHGGIGSGELLSIHLEGDRSGDGLPSRWHLVAGAACVQANDLLEASKRGEILYYKDHRGNTERDSIQKSTTISQSSLFMQSLQEFEKPLGIAEWSARLTLDNVMQYIPVGLRSKIQGGGLEGGEVHQRISIMFIGADHLQLSEQELEDNIIEEQKLLELNDVYQSFTKTVHQYGGEIRDLLFDDKGCVFIAVFGAHSIIELPELKCIRAALKISEENQGARIGVDVGKCFTGMCGTKGRHDFVVMGHEVNMASRFMIGAKPGQVIASPRIKKATSDFIQYTSLTMPYYKNKPVETDNGTVLKLVKESDHHCYTAQKLVIQRTASFIANFRQQQKQRFKSQTRLDRFSRKSQSSFGSSTYHSVLSQPNSNFVGRENELNQIFDFVADTNKDATKGSILISGPEGIGKSALIKEFRMEAQATDAIAFGAAFSIEQNTSYFVLTQLVSCLLFMDTDQGSPTPEKIANRLKELGIRYNHVFVNTLFPSEQNQRPRESIVRLQKRGRKSMTASIGNALGIGSRTQPNDRTSQVIKQITTQLIDKLQAACSTGLIIVVEDMQWIDEDSLQVLGELVKQEFDGVTFIFTCRPPKEIHGEFAGNITNFREGLERSQNHLTMNIDALSEEESNDLARKVLIAETLKLRMRHQQYQSVVLDSRRNVFIDSAVYKLVYERTNGHPNHLVILVKWFIESKSVVYMEKMHAFRFPNQMSEMQARLKLPGTLKDLIVSRLDFLTDGDARAILKVAAVIGPQFDEGLLLHVLNNQGRNISEDTLTQTLEQLQGLGFIALGRITGEDVDEGKRPNDMLKRTPSYTSLTLKPKKLQLGPQMKYRLKRYLEPTAEKWSFTGDITHQAIKSLVPLARLTEIEKMIDQTLKEIKSQANGGVRRTRGGVMRKIFG